jgi:cell wall-associated NlpC family hydrolase
LGQAGHQTKRAARAAALFAAVAILLTIAPAARAAEPVVPWGAGCSSIFPGGHRTSSTCGAELVDGRAIAPPAAPAAVRAVIDAANRIDGRPYVWGGGHRGFLSRGYDCSGAVSYALHGAGLLETTLVSGQLATWGEPGLGRWITVYANPDHVYLVVAGLRFDTRDDLPGVSGPRWHRAQVDPARFVPRHPSGL